MAGHRPWSELTKNQSPERRAKVKALYEQKRIGFLVSEIRKEAGLTQNQLADRIGVGQSAISQMEGSEDMHLATLNKIAKELGCETILRTPSGDVSLMPLHD